MLQEGASAAQGECSREEGACPLEQEAACVSGCFTGACDWSRDACGHEKELLRACPIFDATVLRGLDSEATDSVVYVKGGNALGYGRCEGGSGSCHEPETEPQDLTWTAASAVGSNALSVSEDTAWAVSHASIVGSDGVREVTVEAWVSVAEGFHGRGYVASWENLGLFVSQFADQGYYFGLDSGPAHTGSGPWRQCREEGLVITELHGLITDSDVADYGPEVSCKIIIAPGQPSGGLHFVFGFGSGLYSVLVCELV